MARTTAIEVTRECEVGQLRDGEFRGYWSGCYVVFEIDGVAYQARVRSSNYTRGLPCRVIIEGDQLTVHSQ